MMDELLVRITRLEAIVQGPVFGDEAPLVQILKAQIESARRRGGLKPEEAEGLDLEIRTLERKVRGWAETTGPWWLKGGGELIQLENLAEDGRGPAPATAADTAEPRMRSRPPGGEDVGALGFGGEESMTDKPGKGPGERFPDELFDAEGDGEAVQVAIPAPWWAQGGAASGGEGAPPHPPEAAGHREGRATAPGGARLGAGQPGGVSPGGGPINIEDSLADWAEAIGLAPDTGDGERASGPQPLVFSDEEELLALPDLDDQLSVITPIRPLSSAAEGDDAAPGLRSVRDLVDEGGAQGLVPLTEAEMAELATAAPDLDDFYGDEDGSGFALDLSAAPAVGDAAHLAAEMAVVEGGPLQGLRPTGDRRPAPGGAEWSPLAAAGPTRPEPGIQRHPKGADARQGAPRAAETGPRAPAAPPQGAPPRSDAQPQLMPTPPQVSGPSPVPAAAPAAEAAGLSHPSAAPAVGLTHPSAVDDGGAGVGEEALVPVAALTGPVVVPGGDVEIELADTLVHQVRGHFYEQLKLVKARRLAASAPRRSAPAPEGAQPEPDASPPEEAFLSALESTIRGDVPATEPPPVDAPWETMDGDSVAKGRRPGGSGGSTAMVLGAAAVALMLAVLALPNLPFGLGASSDDSVAEQLYQRVTTERDPQLRDNADDGVLTEEQARIAREVKARGEMERKKAERYAEIEAQVARQPTAEEQAEARLKALRDTVGEAQYAKENFDYKGAVTLYQKALTDAADVPDAELRAQIVQGARTAYILRAEMILKEGYLIAADCQEAQDLLRRARQLGATNPELQGYLESAVRCNNSR